MKKSVLNFVILILISLSASFASLAQTEQELTAESENFYQNYLNQNLNAVQNEVMTKGTHKAAPILRIDPFNPTILFNIGVVIGNVGNNNKNLVNLLIYHHYIRMKPDDVNGYWNFATYLFNSGYVGEADKYYAKANELDANPVYISHYQRGLAAFMNGNYKQCAESMAKATALTPEKGDHRWTYGYLSLCQRAVGDKKNADVNLQKAISLGGNEVKNNIEIETGEYLSASPKNCDDVEKMRREYADKDYNREKDRIKGYREFVKLRNCYPNDGTVSSFGKGQIKRNPDLNYWKAVYEARQEKARNPAQNPFDEVTEKEKQSFFTPKYEEFRSLIDKRQYEKALDLSAELLLIDPQNLQVRNLRALAFLETPALRPLAWREANMALTIYPKSADARVVRARIYYESLKNTDKALAELAEAIKVGSSKYVYHYFLRGKIYYEKKEYAKAINDFDTVLKIQPDYADAAYYKTLAQDPQNAAAIIEADKKINKTIEEYGNIQKYTKQLIEEYNKRRNTVSATSLCEDSRQLEGKFKYIFSELKRMEPVISARPILVKVFYGDLDYVKAGLEKLRLDIEKRCSK